VMRAFGSRSVRSGSPPMRKVATSSPEYSPMKSASADELADAALGFGSGEPCEADGVGADAVFARSADPASADTGFSTLARAMGSGRGAASRGFDRRDAVSAPGGSGPQPSGSALGRGLTHRNMASATSATTSAKRVDRIEVCAGKLPDHSAKISEGRFPRLRQDWKGRERGKTRGKAPPRWLDLTGPGELSC
jgi:hypothetical protein